MLTAKSEIRLGRFYHAAVHFSLAYERIDNSCMAHRLHEIMTIMCSAMYFM